MLREDDNKRNELNEKDRIRKKKIKENKKHPFQLIAVMENIDGFQEECILDKLKTSYI